MPNFAQATIAGHIGRDPSTKIVGSSAVTEFVVAVTPTYPKDSPTMWIDIKAWGKKGEIIADHHKKGDAILLTGSLRMEEWEARDGGGKRSKFVLDVSEFAFIKKDGGGGGQANYSRQGSAHGGDDSPAPTSTINESDIPF